MKLLNFMQKQKNYYLIGPMGAGKSTIGRHIAKALDMKFYDTDQEIEVRTGANISWIFDVEGEEGFRHREESLISELTGLTGIVLATGGSSVLSSRIRNALVNNGTVIYLQASIEQQQNRTLKDRKRPLLQNGNVRNILEAFELEYKPLYESLADITFSTDGRSVRAVADEILEYLINS